MDGKPTFEELTATITLSEGPGMIEHHELDGTADP
jgi:hypothetical protein